VGLLLRRRVVFARAGSPRHHGWRRASTGFTRVVLPQPLPLPLHPLMVLSIGLVRAR
jgi:hypothetical protein